MVSENYKEWWRSLPTDARRELSIATGISLQELSNIAYQGKTPMFNRCIAIMKYNQYLSPKYGVAQLTPHDLDTNCIIKTPIDLEG